MRSQFSREYRLLRPTFDDRCQSSTRSVRARQLLTTVQIISSGSSYVFKPTNISERKRVIEMELFHKTVPHSPAQGACECSPCALPEASRPPLRSVASHST